MLNSAHEREFWIDLSSFSVWATSRDEAYEIAVKRLAEAPLDYTEICDVTEVD